MKYRLRCPVCDNRFNCEISNNADGYKFCCECGECETSIEGEMKNGIPTVVDYEAVEEAEK